MAVSRRVVRVLLLDDESRLLLFRATDEVGKGFWFPPGGGIQEGESVEAAARRELREETGLETVKIGPEVWRRRDAFTWRGVEYLHLERWFMARTSRFVVDTGGFTDKEREDIREHRWWTLKELSQARERLVPRDLASRLRVLMEQGPPARPIEVGV